MPHFSRFFFFVFCATIIFSPATNAAPTLAAEEISQFATVAVDDPLQAQLQIVRRAGRSSLGLSAAPAGSTPTAMTRYEMALETAKAIIAVRARHNADADWDHNANLDAVRALRGLCVAFKSELSGFAMNVPATLDLLDDILAAAGKHKAPARRLQTGSTPVTAPSPAAPSATQNENLLQSLSQRLRIYSALDSLERQKNDPFSSGVPTAFSVKVNGDENFGGVQRLRTSAALAVNPSLQLRAEFEDENAEVVRAPGLRDFLNDRANDAPTNAFSDNPFATNARSIGAGVDLNFMPGVTFSGGVTRLDESVRGDAMRYDGGVGFSGWQNRVALSAHLSRLVPEDSLALGVTAARLNLGVGLTSQIQLKLMYQQMFGANAALQTNPRFGGGLDFRF